MTELLTRLNEIHRPRLLIQAARIGAATYRRDLHLRRLFEGGHIPLNAEALSRLMEMEEQLNEDRITNTASYCAADHVDLLIGMMGEARLLRALYAHADAEPRHVLPFKSTGSA
ncbi:MAG: DUF6477 family protein [Roseovarius sp.]